MIRKLLDKLLGKSEGQEGIETPTDVDATFDLLYQDLKIGTLTLRRGVWRFTYSSDFRKQSDIEPLVIFPDPTREYVSHDLWPFFTARIPGLSQPEVQETIRAEHIDEHSWVELLQRFGQRTISNPFVLQKTA